MAHAKEAFVLDSSKRSLQSMFLVSLAPSWGSGDAAMEIADQLRQRNDLDATDLISFGSAANDAQHLDVALTLFDEVCRMVSENPLCVSDVQPGILLQNTAQLAYNYVLQKNASPDCPTKHYAPRFQRYAEFFLQACSCLNQADVSTFGPPSIFEWFFGMRYES